MFKPKHLVLMGSTGSIGTQTLDVVHQHADKLKVVALSAGKNVDRLIEQVKALQAIQGNTLKAVCLQDEVGRQQFLDRVNSLFNGEVLCGEAGLKNLAAMSEADTLVMGLVGGIGLPPSLTALQTGKRLLTANKETFVTGGHLVKPYLSQIIPVDSEHSAIFQCLQGQPASAVKTLWLTASGGPFLQLPSESFKSITPAQALKHPNWVMGQKVTIDSATLMNKGLEVIEAHWLFGVASEQIKVVIHPQSIIHSGVGFVDGSVLFQAGMPDMRVPIQVALAYPHRWVMAEPACHLNMLQAGPWHFTSADVTRFPCLKLAYQALAAGPHATTVLNAADEWLVDAFLHEQIGFMDIPRLLEAVLSQIPTTQGLPDLSTISELTHWAKQTLFNMTSLMA